ncbi:MULTISPECIES: aspartyl-phosphate phosphatase Spo0E family protein [unclassified Bacillus (in: firmicutes)]|uniref:aspartyl-phosphate phosphatase Spo0E family protein n=1 Tax=Bacillaceae TaxID=186817 RepID=UPI000BEF83C1|nr:MULTISPECIES: aspartyl-phosphate phosphatase Spo0E family protein [unclassified Bacillus (in: firmicutes)]PEJ60767.1 stage 0 sporulation protein [Bacillus sp. AFS002410]PGS46612.1 stage 0 sporulation protein [Bacillus sp. AFS041924]QKE73522.1 aspartyl-phosphate phosphatase Spo0E family protein [Arthrobacter citreus]
MLLHVIEKKRARMVYYAGRYGFTNKKTVLCSQELDRLMNMISTFSSSKKRA